MNKVLDLLERTELNWTVNKEPLISLDELKTESFGLFRNDNDKWLGTVGNRYTVYQNLNLAEVIVKADEKREHLMLGGVHRKNLISYNEIMKFIDSRTKKTFSVG